MWSDVQDRVLLEAVDRGVSYRVIAALVSAVGEERSRNACVGRAGRLHKSALKASSKPARKPTSKQAKPAKHSIKNPSWSADQDLLLIECREAGIEYKEIARRILDVFEINRNISSIANRYYTLARKGELSSRKIKKPSAVEQPAPQLGAVDVGKPPNISVQMCGQRRTENLPFRSRLDPVLRKIDQTSTCHPVAFAQVQAHHCRWPLGDPGDDDFRFCGGQKTGKSSYCTHHHNISTA